MQMIDGCASGTSGLGMTYQRIWSGVAHGQMHGLARFPTPLALQTDPSKVTV